MAIITEDYVSFETAKLLKEKGFGIEEEETRGYYPIKGDAIGRLMFGAEYHHNTSQVQIAAPTLQMTMKWLREVHNIFISIQQHMDCSYVWYTYTTQGVPKGCDRESKSYSYEQSCEAAIKYCLENLI